ncbi:PREDICTED: putative EG45-like domain containing protein 1 [Camelina sativa]|uniref:EG45-like domain containing protein 1 n=1 Tax=Camelina sativa TaxID=90675 RepID=A0ABM0TXT3_CAMSA|nr:PREDICTED: putative EG45-like domain containing protein 1 [Camelina sativa]
MSKNIVAFSNVLVFLFSTSYATPGIGTFYTTYTPSACYGGKQEGVFIAAASNQLWDNGRVCGKMFRVKCTGARNAVPHPCTGKSVTVRIVDHCPNGCASTIDLSREAFAQIANPVTGIINIDYTP